MVINERKKTPRACLLLALVSILCLAPQFKGWQNRSLGAGPELANSQRLSKIKPHQEGVPLYVGAANGKAFILKPKGQGIEVTPLKTALPVFKAFGLSKDQNQLLYTPLKNSIPSGELYVEYLSTESVRKVTDQLVLEAAWSPTDEDKIAYTYSGGQGFGLALAELKTGRCRTLVPDHVLADLLQWNDSGDGIYYFQALADYFNTHLSPRFYSLKSGAAGPAVEPDLPAGFPVIRENVISGPNAETPPQILFSFKLRSPDSAYEVAGDSLLGSGPVQARKLSSGAPSLLADGKLIKVLQNGIVMRSFKGAGSALAFIDWNGQATTLGAPATVGYNLPLKNPRLVQGGSLYPPPGNCNIVSHGPGFGYAYDLASTNIGEHVLASAEGLVVYTISTVTCNTIDLDCPDYDPNGCAGTFLGNIVIVQHSDGTYTNYCHMQKYSVQVPVGAAVCQGSYIGRQGHTGSTGGNVVGCGDHLHFQRTPSPDPLGGTISISFSDVAANPLSCGTTYNSASTESSNSITPAGQSFAEPGGSGTVNVTSAGGCNWLAISNDNWLTITSPSPSAGNGIVTYTVSENTSGLPRAGTMTIAGQIFTVSQDGGGVANQAPVVSAGPDQTGIVPSSVSLSGTASDDGLPYPPGALTLNWIQVSGPGTASFANSSSPSTTATFSLPGVYVLRLTASDGVASTSDDVTVTANTNQPPSVTLVGPADGSSFIPPAPITISASATDNDGSINKVDFLANGTLVGTAIAAPFSIDWANAQPGNYSLTAVATDNLGGTATSSKPLTITVINGNGGRLASSSSAPSANVSLTAEGGLDWAHWGLTSATSFNHKSAVTQQISNFTRIGTSGTKRVNSNPVAYSWTDGTPTPTATNTASGVYVIGVGNGFQVTVPANTTDKTMKLYVGLWKAQGRLEVTLSDASAGAYVDTSLDNNTGSSVRVYSISFRAASSGQQLKIKWTQLNSYDPNGNITLQAATLIAGGGGSTNQAPVVNAGTDQTITLPAGVSLNGTVSDDGLPNPPAATSTIWTKVSGPGTVTFTNPNAANTPASFSAAGVYVLRLTANDGSQSSSDDVSITVNPGSPTNQAPVVNAGSDQTITLPASANLSGTASDDGLPNPPGTLTLNWIQVSGPGTASFANPSSPSTTASFSSPGLYVLQLTADDGALSSSDSVTITVNDEGLLSASSAIPAGAVNLTAEGLLDWAHWGLISATSFNHKGGVTQQISNFTKLGTGSVNRVKANPMTYSWTDGTPTASATNTPSGIYITGVNNGFQLTLPATNTTKTLKLYVGVWKAQGRLDVSLSDGSAAGYVDTSLNDNSATSVRVYTISYRAGSGGQQLKIKWTLLTSYDPFGNITLQAATM